MNAFGTISSIEDIKATCKWIHTAKLKGMKHYIKRM